MRWVLFQLHWLLGITAGLVLAVMGVTGAALSFEDEILMALNPGIATVTPSAAPLLTGPQLAARVRAQKPDARITRIIVQADPALAAWVSYTPAGEKRRETSFVDPASGQLLGPGRGHALFETVMRIHRYLALPGQGNGWGRQITGFSAIALIYFCLSGLYLRWPKRALDWRSWFVIDLRMTGRNLYRALHTIIGSWVLIFYLISGFTGLWWSYGWYRDGMTYVLVGEAEKSAPKPMGALEPADIRPDIALAWQGFERETGGAHYASITASLRDTGDVQFRAKLDDARHDRVSDELVISGVTGATVSAVPYEERALGQDIVTSIFEIHRGAYFGLPGRIAMMLASLTMPLFTITGLLLYLARRRRKRALARLAGEGIMPAGAAVDGSLLIAYASQTGSAERLARLTAASLPGALLVPLHKLDELVLAQAQQLFVIASTYGEGEPPDAARGFARRMMDAPQDLSHVRYAILALGDREYPDFCAFGHSLDHWLHGCGAERLFELIEVDGDDADAQRQWQQQLAGLGARTDQPDWAPAPMGEWRLVERRLLNPGSAGGPAFHIALEPLTPGDAMWMAGDIFEVQPRHDPRRITAFLQAAGRSNSPQLSEALAGRILPLQADAALDPARLPPLAHREYSIASLPSSGRVELIVRQCVADDGLLGLGSGWLTHVAPIGTVLAGRIRTNSAFHPPEDPSKPLILIGNGTGLAGLLAHLHHRATQDNRGPCWLFFGERDPDHDAFHMDRLGALRASGVLDHVELAWSRAVDGGCYVQYRVAQRRLEIEALVDDGASIYVCGSVQGMAPAVHDILEAILGAARLEALLESARYRRDIY